MKIVKIFFLISGFVSFVISDTSLMLDGVYDDVDLCSGTERVFWKFAWKYFEVS